MTCLTSEQLAAIALVHNDSGLPPHVHGCAECRAKLAELRHVVGDLQAAHAEIDQHHAAGRHRLLASLGAAGPAAVPANHWRRFAFGGLGATAAAVLVLTVVFATSFNQLSAMERMVKAIREVRSFSFQQLNTTTYLDPDGQPDVVRHETGYTCWRAPQDAKSIWLGDFYADIKSWRVTPDTADNTDLPLKEKLQLSLSETYPCGKPGMIIVYSEGYYFWTPPLRATEVLNVSPMMKLRAVREGAGRIVRELGTRSIDGREARGYVMDFGGERPFLEMGSVEVWLDPATDLPMEISYEWNKERDKYRDVYRMTDIRWDIDFPADQFATVAPPGLINTTPPRDEAAIAEIIAALRNFAELSGGKYPRVRTSYPGTRDKESEVPYRFDAKVVRDEMLRLAGLALLSDAERANNAKWKQIEASSAGLECLGRILLNHHHAGYFGDAVGPTDKDKVLLWWAAGTEDANGNYEPDGVYRVFYGDLRTEILPDKRRMELMPPEFADSASN